MIHCAIEKSKLEAIFHALASLRPQEYLVDCIRVISVILLGLNLNHFMLKYKVSCLKFALMEVKSIIIIIPVVLQNQMLSPGAIVGIMLAVITVVLFVTLNLVIVLVHRKCKELI